MKFIFARNSSTTDFEELRIVNRNRLDPTKAEGEVDSTLMQHFYKTLTFVLQFISLVPEGNVLLL